MNKWHDIKETIYGLIPNMTVANGYNYDWVEYRRPDTYQPETETGSACLSIHYPEDRPFELRVTDDVRTTQNRETWLRDIDIVCRVISDNIVTHEETVIDLNNDALDKARWDVKRAINTGTLNDCALGIRAVDVVDVSKIEIDSNGVYFPFLLQVNYNITYEEKREF